MQLLTHRTGRRSVASVRAGAASCCSWWPGSGSARPGRTASPRSGTTVPPTSGCTARGRRTCPPCCSWAESGPCRPGSSWSDRTWSGSGTDNPCSFWRYKFVLLLFVCFFSAGINKHVHVIASQVWMKSRFAILLWLSEEIGDCSFRYEEKRVWDGVGDAGVCKFIYRVDPHKLSVCNGAALSYW